MSIRDQFRKTKRVVESRTRRLRTRPHRLRKWLYQRRHPSSADERQVALIVGCQRSGTTLLGRIFDDDLRSIVLHEDSALTRDGFYRLRLKPYPEVNAIVENFPAQLVVAKPLAECQNTIDMLTQIRASRAIWMFRNYRDVVNSSVARFRSQIHQIRGMVDPEPEDWRAEKLSEATLQTLSRFCSHGISRADAAALFWYARNRLFFEQNLEQRHDVILCEYERLIAKPNETMHELYEFLEVGYPARDITRGIDALSIGGGAEVELKCEIEELCSKLHEQLRAEYQARSISRDTDEAAQPLGACN